MSGALVGVVLSALAVGYALGGSLATRYPSVRLPSMLLLSAACWVALVIRFHWTLIEASSRLGTAGLIAAAVLVFAAPTVAMSVVCPYAVRLLASDRTGLATGNVYAVSTVGSLVGVFTNTLVLLPTIGTHSSLIVASASLVVSSILLLFGA